MALQFEEPVAQAKFESGALALQYYTVSFQAGDYPNRLNGVIQVTPDDGATLTSTIEEVQGMAKTKIQSLVTDGVDEG